VSQCSVCGHCDVCVTRRDHALNLLLTDALSGIGGLGHLAIQYAAKLGHHVTVFSSSADKEAEAKALGTRADLVYHRVHPACSLARAGMRTQVVMSSCLPLARSR